MKYRGVVINVDSGGWRKVECVEQDSEHRWQEIFPSVWSAKRFIDSRLRNGWVDQGSLVLVEDGAE